MKKPILAVYDKKTGIFDPSFKVTFIGDAVREWDNLKKDPNNRFGRNPEDFDLFHIADYDESQGTFETLKPHNHLATGV